MNKTYPGFRASDKPQCKRCAGFLPESDDGHNRAMCANCGAPNSYYIRRE